MSFETSSLDWTRAMVALGTILTASMFVAACSTGPQEDTATQPTAQEIEDATRLAPSVAPAVSVNALMVAIVDHAAHEIWDVSVTAPANEFEWTQLEYHAIQLAASGTFISMGGSGPADAGWAALPAWQEFSQQLTDVGKRAIGAARSRSVGALEEIGDDLVATCEGCHQEFKPDLPTEGLVPGPYAALSGLNSRMS